MSAEEIPDEIRAFLYAYIPSVGHMEALVLTVEEPGQPWTPEALAARLYVSEARADTFLRDLCTARLIVATENPTGWRFAPPNPARVALARQAVRLYRARLLQVTGIILAGAGAGRQLADAFRFRKD